MTNLEPIAKQEFSLFLGRKMQWIYMYIYFTDESFCSICVSVLCALQLETSDMTAESEIDSDGARVDDDDDDDDVGDRQTAFSEESTRPVAPDERPLRQASRKSKTALENECLKKGVESINVDRYQLGSMMRKMFTPGILL